MPSPCLNTLRVSRVPHRCIATPMTDVLTDDHKKTIHGRVPADRLGATPAARDWSSAEVLHHVISSGAGVGRRIGEAIERQDAAAALFEDRLEHAGADLSVARARELLLAEREALFAAALAADPAAHLNVTAIEHQWFGPLNWKAALLFLRVHDLDHARQIEAIATSV